MVTAELPFAPASVRVPRRQGRRHGLIVDSFAGGGGASTGIEMALGRPVDLAINHDAHAILMHKANHPRTHHLCESVWRVDPREACDGAPVDLLWLSPDCRHFSRAKGAKPVQKKIRGLAWLACAWASTVRPKLICLENVREFQDWGPLRADSTPCPDRRGLTFRRFVGRLRNLGYRVDWRVFDAADYGAPTHRRRLFLVARCDGAPITWPTPTHGPGRAHAWRTAAECIDWTIPCPSIFERERPLADATCRRIAHGIVRFVLNGEPFIIETGNGERPGQAPRVRGLDAPMWTVTGTGSQGALVCAFLAKHYGGVVGTDLRAPVGTITSIDHHSLVAAHLTTLRGSEASHLHGDDARAPLRTISAGGSHHALVAAFLTTYYSGGGTASRPDAPMPAIVTKARHGLVLVDLHGEQRVLADIGMRMLQPRELARAQGFPDSYILPGTKAEQIARIGNSVCPVMAEAIVRANVVDIPARIEAIA